MKQETKLTATQRTALDNLLDTVDIGEAGSIAGPARFSINGDDETRIWPAWGPKISTYRALVKKGFAVAEDSDKGITFSAI